MSKLTTSKVVAKMNATPSMFMYYDWSGFGTEVAQNCIIKEIRVLYPHAMVFWLPSAGKGVPGQDKQLWNLCKTDSMLTFYLKVTDRIIRDSDVIALCWYHFKKCKEFQYKFGYD